MTLRQATLPCLDAVIQLRRSPAHDMPPPQHLSARFRSLVERMASDLQHLVGRQEADDVRYAIVALIDEVAQQHPALGEAWHLHLLQAHYFQESNAGNGFYQRLDDLMRRQASMEILRVYYECLLLGFQGRYAWTEHERLEVVDRVRDALLRGGMRAPEQLSSSGARPPEVRTQERRRMWLLVLPVAMALVALGAYVAMRYSVQDRIDAAIEVLVDTTGGAR